MFLFLSMNTQIVYTLISSSNDIYLEQLWISVYSLRMYNKQVSVVVLTDTSTYEYMRNRKDLIKIIDDIKIVNVPCKYNNVQKSRYLKTTVRQHIKGKFLFIDTDTIITNNIEEIDNISCQIACVPDLHTTFKDFPSRESVIELTKSIFEVDVSDSKFYFNSGVMLVDDNELTHNFYESWHNNWEYSSCTKGVNTDQQSLIKTDKDYNYILEPMSGIYNCQILGSIQYLYDAKIMHFFNATWSSNMQCHPFFGKDIYMMLKKEQRISLILENNIRNCKSLFPSPSMIITDEYFRFIFSAPFHNMYKLYHTNPTCYEVINFIIRIINKLFN